jgi:hypothetical protein
MLSDIITNIGNECGYEVEASNIVNASDVTTKMLLGMCNRVIKEMADAYNWTRLRKSYTFDLEDGIATYALPTDFSYYHYETFWNQDTQWKLYGALSSQQYGERVGYGDLLSVYDEFTIRGVTDNEITIYPTPGTGNDGETISFEYTSARPVRPRTWQASLSVTSASYIFYNGNYYTAGSTGTTGATPPTHTTGSASDGTISWTYYAGKYESFLADTDVAVLSERILEQGVMERFASIKQLNVNPLFQSQLEDEYGKTVNGKVLYAGGYGAKDRFMHAKSSRVSFGS